jgi:hypothetical protein
MRSGKMMLHYHSSVLHSEQGRSYFIMNDGRVPTMAYRRPEKTHILTWKGTARNTFFPPRYLHNHGKTEVNEWYTQSREGQQQWILIYDLTKSCTCKCSTPNQSIRQHCFQPTFAHTPRRSMLPQGKAACAMQGMGE